MSQLSFHSEMIRIFDSMRDGHTNYYLPLPYRDIIAILPFLIEECFDGDQRKYIVSRLAAGLDHPTFKPGAEVLYWNGVPIEREIDLNADQHKGSNAEANHARGLNTLTFRVMLYELPPDEEWVVIGYRSLSGEVLELKQKWLTISLNDVGAYFPKPSTKAVATQGIDKETYIIQQTKKVLFAPDIMKAQIRINSGEISIAQPPNGLETSMPSVLVARKVTTSSGSYGYIRIYTFAVDDVNKFIDEIRNQVKQLPQNGLIIDVRNNGGGDIWAGESLLQLFTPNHIKPELFGFINTPLTYELCRRNSPSPYDDLSPWFKSFEQIIDTGATFSQDVPLTPEDRCNNIGQIYYGPVLLITDALCYSTTDMFAAGFQDHKIGPILGTSGNTGAGGANVWTHTDIENYLRQGTGDSDSQIKSLPNESEMRVAMRRSLRIREREGMPLEELGVVPDASLYISESTGIHKMTKQDLLSDNIDLINHAASILAKMPVYKLSLEISPDAEELKVKTETENVSRLDVFIDDRPQQSIDIKSNLTQFVLKRPQNKPSFIKVESYKDNNLVAAYRTKI